MYHLLCLILEHTLSTTFLEGYCCLATKSYPTLWDPVVCSPPGSSVRGILQARIQEWWPFPSPGDLPNPGIEPRSRTLWVAFFFFNYFIDKYNCFIEFCCFLSNLNMNQPYVYIYPLLCEAPLHLLPPHRIPLDWYRALVWVSWAIQQIPVGYLFTYGNVSFHVILSIHLTLSSPLPMSINLLSMSVSPLLPCK